MNPKRLLLLPILAAFGVCLNLACAQIKRWLCGPRCRMACAVIIVRNTLAPVGHVQANFLVGGDETPTGFQGWPTRRSTWRFADARG